MIDRIFLEIFNNYKNTGLEVYREREKEERTYKIVYSQVRNTNRNIHRTLMQCAAFPTSVCL